MSSTMSSKLSSSLELKGMIELISVIKKMQIATGRIMTGHVLDEEKSIAKKLRAHINKKWN